MITLEDYELQYNLYLAESELFNNLISLGEEVVNESSGLMSIQEGVKETVINYLSKISTAIQEAWNKFKEILTRGADIAYLKSIEKRMQNAECNFTATYTEYDMNKLNGIKLIPFNYEDMKESLSSKEDFLAKYYPDIKLDEKNKSVKEVVQSICVKSRDEVKCDGQLLKKMYRFVTVDYKAEMSKLEADLKTVNTSNKNIQNLVSTVMPAETASNEAAIVYESYILEADDNKEEDKTTGKVEFKDPPKDENNTNENKSTNKESITKAVTTYCSVSTDILTGKMKVVKDMYSAYMTIIKHYIHPPKKEKENEEKKPEENNSTEKVKDIKA